MAEKIIRDPVHDVIAFRLERPVDAMLFRLINAAEFQRLRRIRQLGMASLVYPGADHSRYSHSLGVMETARRMIEQLGRSITIDSGQSAVCLAAALLHDLGHGPFSHLFEHVSGISHEELTRWIVHDPSSEIHQVLKEYDVAMPQRVSDFFQDQPRRTFLNDVVSSQLDADRFDYLLRDNLHTGSRYGDFDLGWLLHALTTDQSGSRLAVTAKGISAVEAYLQSRYHMYRNVYFHKVVRAAEGMLKLALQRAGRLAAQDRLPWPSREDGVCKLLQGRKLSVDEFTNLDDVSLLHCLKLWIDSDDVILARLCKGLLFRGLFKSIDLTPINDRDQLVRLIESAKAAVRSAGGDPTGDIFYDEPSDAPYEIYDGQTSTHDIFIRDNAGNLSSVAVRSPLPQALGRQLMFRRLHVAAAYRNAVEAAIRQ